MLQLPQDTGWIEVICGPMFSGKTEELIRRLRRALYARQVVQAFKPTIDNRYDRVHIVSHDHQKIEAQPVDEAADILKQINSLTQVVAIDEAQFFDEVVVDVAQQLANRGLRVIVAGLDQDFRNQPFVPMPDMIAVAEFVSKMQAICVICGNPASRTQRLKSSDEQVMVGARGAYEARCRRCHTLQADEVPEKQTLFS